MSIFYRQIGSRIVISGKTYPHRDAIKALGARFDGAGKVWFVSYSESSLEQISRLCRQYGGGELPSMNAGADQSSQTSAEHTSQPEPMLTVADDDMTVAKLLQRAEMAITSQFPKPIWLVGELDAVQERESGYFLSIAEPKGNGHAGGGTLHIQAIMWRNVAEQIRQQRGAKVLSDVLQEGMRVRVLVNVSLYRDRAQVSLSVLDVDPNYTKGALALAREKLLKELRSKGLDRLNKQLQMPWFPFRVGLITADGSRAKSDFLDQLRAGGFPGEVLFKHAPMQGEQTTKSVVTCIQALEKADCDLIVITRGGGSVADLRWFDSKDMAVAIAHARCPIVAAIGHHDDVCVAEEICYLRQKTPTAAAEFIVGLFAEVESKLEELTGRAARRLNERLNRAHDHLSYLAERWQRVILTWWAFTEQKQQDLSFVFMQAVSQVERNFTRQLEKCSSKIWDRWVHVEMRQKSLLMRSRQILNSKAESRLLESERNVASLLEQIVKKDPTPWMEAGWTQLQHNGSKLDSIRGVKLGAEITARLQDGSLRMTVTETEKKIRSKGES